MLKLARQGDKSEAAQAKLGLAVLLWSCLLAATVLPTQTATAAVVSVRTVALNLHGYHPYQQAERELVSRDGRRQSVWPHLHYFNRDELKAGHLRRLDELASQFGELDTDLILLQEVGAGRPEERKDCRVFYDRERRDDWRNSALQLADRLQRRDPERAWSTGLACRGNIGWITSDRSFATERVETASGQVIFDYGENPYPRGVLIEGFAVLARAPWHVRKSMTWELTINQTGQTTSLQLAEIEWQDPQSGLQGDTERRPWFLVLNLHAGHKIEHFEQAVAIRRAVTAYLADRDAGFLGVMAGGDFNARLYSGNADDWQQSPPQSEVSTLPWQLFRDGSFDWRVEQVGVDLWRTRLTEQLTELNRSSYKNWASISDRGAARERIDRVVNRLLTWQQEQPDALGWSEGVRAATAMGRCRRFAGIESACTRRSRIDHIFLSPNWLISGGSVLWPSHSFSNSRGLSDHPGILVDADLLIARPQ